ncbi:MAG: hypothetical protein F6K17_14330 [Okeania sp. SIO3C4]|nr:hypothetical protein [Okeania sp. SIO3C4]
MQASTGSARKTVAAVIIANVFPILAKFVSLLVGFSVFFMGFFESRSKESSKVDYLFLVGGRIQNPYHSQYRIYPVAIAHLFVHLSVHLLIQIVHFSGNLFRYIQDLRRTTRHRW